MTITIQDTVTVNHEMRQGIHDAEVMVYQCFYKEKTRALVAFIPFYKGESDNADFFQTVGNFVSELEKVYETWPDGEIEIEASIMQSFVNS